MTAISNVSRLHCLRPRPATAAAASLPPLPRGLHSSNFQLNLSALYGIGGARRDGVARVKGLLGGVYGVSGVFACQTRLKLSRNGNECKPLPLPPLPCGLFIAACSLVSSSSTMPCRLTTAPMVQRRKLKLKAEVESSMSHFSFKRLVPGGFNVGLIGSTCTALP